MRTKLVTSGNVKDTLRSYLKTFPILDFAAKFAGKQKKQQLKWPYRSTLTRRQSCIAKHFAVFAFLIPSACLAQSFVPPHCSQQLHAVSSFNHQEASSRYVNTEKLIIYNTSIFNQHYVSLTGSNSASEPQFNYNDFQSNPASTITTLGITNSNNNIIGSCRLPNGSQCMIPSYVPSDAQCACSDAVGNSYAGYVQD